MSTDATLVQALATLLRPRPDTCRMDRFRLTFLCALLGVAAVSASAALADGDLSASAEPGQRATARRAIRALAITVSVGVSGGVLIAVAGLTVATGGARRPSTRGSQVEAGDERGPGGPPTGGSHRRWRSGHLRLTRRRRLWTFGLRFVAQVAMQTSAILA